MVKLLQEEILMGDETEEADYFFKIRKGKLVPGGNIVTGFTNLIC